MFAPDPDQQHEAFAQVERSLEQMERDFGVFFKRLVWRWAVRWAITFGVIFVLTRLVDWLDWLWWIAVPFAAISLIVPLVFRRFLMKRLAKARGSLGGGRGGATIDGSWRETTGDARHETPHAQPGEAEGEGGGRDPGTIIIDQRPDERR